MSEKNTIITPGSLLRRHVLSIDQAIQLYSINVDDLKKHFQKFNSDPNDGLYLFPSSCYELIPEGFIVEEVKYIRGKYERKFIEFIYDPNFTKMNNERERSYFKWIRDQHKTHLDVGININYSYNELIIKNIIE